jgi:Ca2+-binding EF-hand superfamily protein
MQRTTTGSDPVTKLHPAQLRDMRESFQVLDRDNDGQVNRDDVAEVLVQLGAPYRSY